jgi:hypothetical protein
VTNSSNVAFDRAVVICFAVVVALVGIWTLSNGIWLGTLFDGDRTWLIHLDNHPVWNPPALPSFADFQKVFADLPPQQSPGSTIGIELEWNLMLISFLLYLSGVSVLFGIHTLIRPGWHSLGIYVIRSLALSLSGAAATSFIIWLLAGGWGPPLPLFFGLVGLIGGIWLGVSRWLQHNKRRISETRK